MRARIPGRRARQREPPCSNVLAKVAFYQPAAHLGDRALGAGASGRAGGGARRAWISYTYTDQDVREAAAPVLRTAAYDPDLLCLRRPTCCGNWVAATHGLLPASEPCHADVWSTWPNSTVAA